MKKTKKILSLILAILMLVSVVPVTDLSIRANATTKSADDAINWVRSQVGKSIDTDGFPSNQPYQCVDLIKAYYSYLGVSPVSGNGADYASNALPAGWQRLQGVQPQKGDILVYTGGYGHVAIYESDRVHYHQNFDNMYYVTKVTYKYNGLSNPYWGVIRPNWDTSYFTNVWSSDVTETDAKINATISGTNISTCGFYLGTSQSSMNKRTETVNGYVENIWYTMSLDYGALSKGTTYYYKFFIVVSGVEYCSNIYTFKTNGCNHSYTSTITTHPTCTKEGVKTYKCFCGASYTETIAKTSHNSNTTIPAVSATCTKTGLTEGKKCSVCGTITVAQQTVAKKAHTEEVDKAVSATCTKAGLTEGKHCSICGAVTVAQNVIAAIGHKDNNFDGKCDNCGISSSSPNTPDDSEGSAEDCSCNCHKGGFIGVFFKIVNFFQKLFGMNKVCTCGVKH